MPNKTQNYASAFKGSLSPCKKNGHYWNATGGTSLFELYTSLKNKVKKGGTIKKSKSSGINRLRRTTKKVKKSISKIGRRKYQKGGVCSLKHTSAAPYPGNPPYGLTTTPYKEGNPQGKSAPIGLKLYERAFQGPFPSRAAVNFDLETPFDNQLIVEPVPAQVGSGKKKKIIKKKKKSITKKVKSALKKKKSVTKKKKSVTKKKKSVTKKKKSVTKKKKSTIKRIKTSIKKKKLTTKKHKKKKVMKGG